jgi:hypothetical protein
MSDQKQKQEQYNVGQSVSYATSPRISTGSNKIFRKRSVDQVETTLLSLFPLRLSGRGCPSDKPPSSTRRNNGLLPQSSAGIYEPSSILPELPEP